MTDNRRHRRRCFTARAVRPGIHDGNDVANHKLFVDDKTHGHVVDRIARFPRATIDVDRVGLGIDNASINLVEAVASPVPAKVDLTMMERGPAERI